MDDNHVPDIGLNEAVKECPYCGCKISPIYLTHYEQWYEDQTVTYHAICECPNKACNEVFFVKYTAEPTPIQEPYGTGYILDILKSETFPYTISELDLDKYINDISPDFIETYKQASLADKMNLNKISGAGFRLAFEILIKDFAASLNPEKADDIKNDLNVSNVISNRIPSKPMFDDIKDIARRSWWLGCDSSHYIKEFTEFDIKDLKECIDITVASIVYYSKHKHYVDSINKVKS